MLKPVAVTHWYCPLKLLDSMVRRVRPMIQELEWWVIYGRYPMLGVRDGVSDTRGAQNLCKELGLDWWDVGDDVSPSIAIQKWALEVGSSWSMDRKVLQLAYDALPSSEHFLGLLELEGAGRDMEVLASKSFLNGYNNYPGVNLSSLSAIFRGHVITDKASYVPREMCEEIGGPARFGGMYADDLYDAEYLEWAGTKKEKAFRKWLEDGKK